MVSESCGNINFLARISIPILSLGVQVPKDFNTINCQGNHKVPVIRPDHYKVLIISQCHHEVPVICDDLDGTLNKLN